MPQRNGYELLRFASQDLSLYNSHWIFYTWKDRDFEHAWAFKGSLLSAYVNKTDGKVSTNSQIFNYLQGDDPPDGMQTLITEFHNTKRPEIKSYISRRLIDYSLPSLVRVVNNYIHPENQP
jgi:hypothetical protein